MTKKLHKIHIYYDVMVVADTTDYPINIANEEEYQPRNREKAKTAS